MLPHVDDAKTGAIEDEPKYYAEKSTDIKLLDWFLLNRPLKVIIAISFVAILSPLLIYQFMFFASHDFPPSDGHSFGSCLVSRDARIPCGIESVTQENCHAQCCYDFDNNICFHRFPSRFSYITEDDWTEETILNSRIPSVPYKSQESIENIRLSIDEISPTHLSLTFYQSENALIGQRIDEKFYSYSITHPELNIAINSTQGSIFNTLRGPIIASDNIWEIAFKITNETMYGLGEIPLKEGTTKVLYNHDGGMTIPLIFGKNNITYHGLLIDTKNPTEIMVRSDNQLVVRSISNWGIKFHLFVGPRPSDVMRDVSSVIGARKELEYWSLGAHVCSENTTEDSVSELNAFISAARSQEVPFESHCGLAPIVFNTTCNDTHVAIVDQGATIVKNAGKRFVPHVAPYIYHKESLTDDDSEEESEEPIEEETRDIETNNDSCFDKHHFKDYLLHDSESNETVYKGEVNNHSVIYPNYENADSDLMEHLWLYNSDFDGLILENNWPLDEKYKHNDEIYNILPYFTKEFDDSFNHTLQWNATKIIKDTTDDIRHEKYFYTHNEYGNQQAAAFEKIKGPVPMLSTSQWMNGNITVNRQRIPTTWSSLHKEFIEASLGGISGLWYWSSPICGDTEAFDNVAQVRLCAKWYKAAAYMPMIKIHSKTIRRDPLAFTGTDNNHIKTALTTRMSLLPYFYTVLQQGPLLRPMFYQFPETDELKDVSTQFAVGYCILIVPNLTPSQTHVHVVLPPGFWYEFWSGMLIEGEVGQGITMTTTDADLLTLIRGGSIVVMQKDTKLTVDETRLQSPFTLIIALNCTTTDDINSDDENNSDKIDKHKTCQATGELYLTSNLTINFEATSEVLKINTTGDDLNALCDLEAEWAQTLKELSIYGLDEDKNNYDHHRSVIANIDLCRLETEEEIIFNYVEETD